MSGGKGMKVLIATDGSEQATTAMRTAARVLCKEGNQFDLLCVAPRLTPRKRGSDKTKEEIRKIHADYQGKITKEAKKILELSKVVMSGEGIIAGTVFETGSPANVIIDKSEGYDLTVVGAHDKYEKEKPGLGPVALRVIAQAPTAVLIARELAAEKALRILIATDGSLAAEEAISLMTDYFNVQLADITVMHIVETPWINLGLEPEWFDFRGRNFDRSDPTTMLDHEIRIEAEDVIETARKRLESAGLGSEPMIVEGDPALELLSEAEKGEYDLIVLGATGISDFKHDLLGSVSIKVARDASCSVFIVKFAE